MSKAHIKLTEGSQTRTDVHKVLDVFIRQKHMHG